MSNNENLALRYRPKTLEDLVGQKQVQLFLRQALASNHIPTGLIFAGMQGVGKTSVARIFAASLNCAQSTKPCGECKSCKAIFSGHSHDVLEIDAASNGGVDSIRSLREQVLFSTNSNYKALILDEAQGISKEGYNALLKTLEEPPPNTVFMLLTTEPNKIPDNILTRCMLLPFNKVNPRDIVGRLEYICDKEELKADDELLLAIAQRANGGMRDAIMTLDQLSQVGIASVEDFHSWLGNIDFAPTLLNLIAQGNFSDIYEAVDDYMLRMGDVDILINQLILTLKDVLVFNEGGVLIHHQGKALEERQQLAASFSVDKCIKIMKILWEVTAKATAIEGRAKLDLAVALMTNLLVKKEVKQTVEPKAPPRKLTLAEMKALS